MLLLQQQKTKQHQQYQQQEYQKTNNKKNYICSNNTSFKNECITTITVNNRIKENKNFNKRNNNKILKVKTLNNWMPAAIVNVQQQQRLEVEAEQGETTEKRKKPKQHHHYHYQNHQYHQQQQQQEQHQHRSITKSNINLCIQIRATEPEVQQQHHQQQQQQQQQHQHQHNYHKYQEQHDNQQYYQHRQNGAKNTTKNAANTYSTIPTTSTSTTRTSTTRTSPTISANTITNPIQRASEISRADTNTKGTRRVATTTRLVIIIMTLVFGIVSNQQQQQEKLSWYNGIYMAAAAAAAATTTEVESTPQIPAATYFYNNSNIEYHNLVSSSRDENLQKDLESIKQPQSEPQTETTNYTFKSLAFIDDGRLKAVASSTSLAVAKVEQQSLEALPIFDFGMPRNITGRTGYSEALIKCRVDKLNDKSVSWIRKRDLHILTVATATYTSDKRFEVTESKDSREWTLHVKAPQTRDSGIYECQVNTEPKMSMAFQLNIIEISPDAKAIISGPPDLHFKVGSAIILNCVVQQPSGVKDIGPIYWYRGEHMITPFEADDALNTNDDDDDNEDGGVNANVLSAKPSTIGGAEHNEIMTNDILVHQQKDFAARIAMESQLGDTLKSRLRISNAQTMDTGNYTCQPTTANSASVMVHVINDENPAAMQKSAAVSLFRVALSFSLEGAFLIEVLQVLVLLLPLIQL